MNSNPTIVKIFFALAMFAAPVGGLIAVVGVVNQGGPAAAATVAFGGVVAVVPYLLARGLQELVR